MSQLDDLATAIKSGDASRVEQLLRQHPDLVNSTEWRPPPLHCAVLWNQPQVVEVLLENGADIEMRDPDRETTPLRYAILYCKKDVIPILLARGANAGAIKQNGSTAIELAVQAGNGGFEAFDDMPSRAEYREVIDILQQCGVE